MLAAGRQVQEIAHELGVNPRTITRWSERGDVRALIRKHRESLLPEAPTAEAVLTTALSATKPNGQPDWANRITAARALLSAPVASGEAQEAARRVERIYVSPNDGGVARADPRTDPFHEPGAG